MTYANRGMNFEEVINLVNEKYREKGIAFIEKKPTPIKVIRTKPNGHILGCFEKKSSVDYSGICHGRCLYFEAKSTKTRTRFSLANIQDHQIETLMLVRRLGGIAFFLIEFSKHEEVYILTLEQAIYWLNEAEEGGRKSIPYEYFLTECERVERHKDIPLHYLDSLGVLA